MLTSDEVLVVVPALNEAASIGPVLADLRAEGLAVLVVSDGSTDDTAQIARRAGALVLDLPYNMGVGGALRAGFQVAVERGFEAIVQVDADGQHPVQSIRRLIESANMLGAHMVIGSRFISDGTTMDVSTTRRLVMQVLARSASRATNTKITDSSSGFRLIRNPLLKQFSIEFSANYLGDTYESVISAGRAGYVVREIPAPMEDRTAGVSTASWIQSVQSTLKGLGISAFRLHSRIEPFDPSAS